MYNMKRVSALNKRYYGIDLLRILSMVLVVMTHTLNRGGILSQITPQSFPYYSVSCIDIVTKTAVDCFAIISGFVMYGRSIKYRRILTLWLPAFTYSAVYFIVVSIIKHSFSFGEMINSIFPVLSSKWWYLSAYVGAFFLFPFINKLIDSLTDKGVKKLLIILFIVFSLSQFVSTLAVKTYYFVGGYNVVWLLVLYSFGAIIRRLGLMSVIKKKTAAICMLISVVIVWLWKIVFDKLDISFFNGYLNSDSLSMYTSPAVVLFAFFAVVLFAQFDIKKTNIQKTIVFFSSSAFSVYLIQELVYKENMFSFVAEQKGIIMILLILGIPIAVFLVCTVVEHMRKRIFSWLKIEEKLNQIIDLINNKCSKVYKNICSDNSYDA